MFRALLTSAWASQFCILTYILIVQVSLLISCRYCKRKKCMNIFLYSSFPLTCTSGILEYCHDTTIFVIRFKIIPQHLLSSGLPYLHLFRNIIDSKGVHLIRHMFTDVSKKCAGVKSPSSFTVFETHLQTIADTIAVLYL